MLKLMFKKIFIILRSNIFFQIYVYMLSDNAVGIEEIGLLRREERNYGWEKETISHSRDTE